MSISKFAMASAVLVAASFTAMPMSAFAASDIKNTADCKFEGGTMTNVKGSDYCLVQIRPKEYAGAEYDGNRLGVVDCPGSKLNDGVFCMYPVTIKKSPSTSILGSVLGGSTPAKSKAGVSSIVGAVTGSGDSGGSMKEKAGTALLKNKILGGKKSTTDVLLDVAKDELKDKAEDAAKKAISGN